VQRPIPLPPLGDEPLVSVFITNYNYARFVGEAIESVLAQTYRNLELIVVDDGSTDDSLKTIARYSGDPRIKVIEKSNGGMASAWNEAYRHCRGEVIFPLDADDVFYTRKIEVLIDALGRDASAGLVVHAMTVRDGAGHDVQQIPFLSRFEQGWISDRVIARGGRWRYMPTSALGFRRELAALLFPVCEQTFFIHADALVVTLGPLLTHVVAVNEPLSYYRVHGANSLGGDVQDLKSAGKVIDFALATTRGVNARLNELGIDLRIDEGRNLEFLQAQFVHNLFDGTCMAVLIGRYFSLARALLSDDLYRGTQKILGIMVYGIATILPRSLRAGWIGNALGYSRFKRAVQEMLRIIKSVIKPISAPLARG